MKFIVLQLKLYDNSIPSQLYKLFTCPPMHCTLLPMIPINLILYSFSTVTPGPTQDSFGSHEPLESGGHDVESIITND